MRAALLALALLLALPLASAQSIPRPTWTEGDMWEYPSEGGGALVVRVAGLDALTNGTDNVTAWRVTTFQRAPDSTLDARATVWYRTSDLARLREATPGPNGTRTLSFDEGCIDTPFPLRANASWDVSCVGTELGSERRFTLRYHASVRGIENVTVPVGTFRTLAIVRELPGGEETEHWSTDACHWVRKESAEGALAMGAFRCEKSGLRAVPDATPTPAGTPEPTRDAPGLAPAGVLLALVVAVVARRQGASR